MKNTFFANMMIVPLVILICIAYTLTPLMLIPFVINYMITGKTNDDIIVFLIGMVHRLSDWIYKD